MVDLRGVKIAVDFDGTIVEHVYPEIGKENLFAFQTLKKMNSMGACLILWTFRAGKELEEAVEFCRANGVEFYAVNKNYPEEVYNENISRKINADIFIDDKNVGGFPGWGEIWQMIDPYEIKELEAQKRLSSSTSFFKRLFRKQKTLSEKLPMSIFTFLLISPLVWSLSCSGRTGNSGTVAKTEAPKTIEAAAPNIVRFVAPENDANVKLLQTVEVVLEARSANRTPDSIALFFEGKYVETMKLGEWKCNVDGNMITATGRKSLKAIAYKDGKQSPVTQFFTVLSDKAPKKYGYKIIKTYPHDVHAFTQGLFFDNGLLYESTGQETESSLRETEIATGKPRRQLNLDASLFGEGITLYNDRIFQVTWQNKVGFVYDKATFRQINKLYYPTEGWGLTTIDNRIVLSDGSNILYFHEPEMFSVVSKIEVYDDEKKVEYLNELEYIEGEIWANIWLTDLIARIDPISGKVNGYIDLSGIFPQNERNGEAEVLNGIAYDKETKRIFVTGKRWARLFEIVVTE